MFGNVVSPLEIPSVLTFDDYQVFTAAQSSYQHAPNPGVVLRSGLTEEVVEILGTDPSNRADMHKEIGDGTYYSSEVARYGGFTLREVVNLQDTNFVTFDDFQDADNEFEASPLCSPQGILLEDPHNPQQALAVRAMRVIDVLNPKTDELWIGCERPSLQVVVHEFLLTLRGIAIAHDIRLNDAVTHTLTVNHNRPRKPHVIDNAKDMVSSGRDRLAIDPWVTRLLSNVATDNA